MSQVQGLRSKVGDAAAGELAAILEDLERDMSGMLARMRAVREGRASEGVLCQVGLEFVCLLGEARRARALVSGRPFVFSRRGMMDGKSRAAGEREEVEA